ncbi:MAG TPA: ABC transporter substrate-binding protein [Desulfomicrobiaceae bacterium]|nr:ABC transporter substrate-binding protein [Desulfomicrobiaceae bacterium]
MIRMMFRLCLVWCVLTAGIGTAWSADPVDDPGWKEIVDKAAGQEVYWKAWAGQEATNSYIRWVTEEVRARFGIVLHHVKITNPSELVSGTLAEKTAGKNTDGATDLLWINGENFLAMKENGLLFGPFVSDLPNVRKYVDMTTPSFTHDFTVPVEGFEAPWGLSQVVFIYDTAVTPNPPKNMQELLAYAKAHPGRITHPQVRYFMGYTFLKQALYEMVEDRSELLAPATDENFDRVTAPLWAWYDELRPHLWSRGTRFPESGQIQNQLLADGEVDLSLSFWPFEASQMIRSGMFPKTVRTYVMDIGTIGNANFLAIPYNSSSREAAMVVINFLLSPEAQLLSQDPTVRGTFSVLDMDRLPEEYRRKFAEMDLGPATLSAKELGTPLAEPHPSWLNRLVDEWHERYAD